MQSSFQLPIGYDNFGKIRENQLDFVDKTLFIRDILDDRSSEVLVITRPRRFGKTLNLSMLQYFFADQAYGCKTQGLFDDLKIAALGEPYMQHQGKYPVIFITLKDLRDLSFQPTVEKLGSLLSQLYRENSYLLQSNQLDATDKEFFTMMLGFKIPQSVLEESLHRLMHYLSKHHGQKVWLLIDEYDSPLHSAFLNNYYPEMISLIRNLFSGVLKSNPYLKKAVITGILRIAKESLFSGLNNVTVHTLLSPKYSEYFGFTEAETTDLFTRANLTPQIADIRRWYNGYLMGNTVIYNPWSIVNCIYNNGLLRPYWVNTSGNDLIRSLLAEGDLTLKDDLEKLLNHQPIQALIDENMVFGDLNKNNNAIWSLLLFSGYLKAISAEMNGTGIKVQLVPPNYEVLLLYRSIIRGWFDDSLGYSNYQNFLKSLTRGDVEEFTLRLKDCIQNSFSIFDVSGHHPEKFYHGFVLGMIISLEDRYDVQSNKESGYGRYDVMLIPKDPAQLGIVMEFKTVTDANLPLTEAADLALQQVLDRDYAQTLRSRGIQRILQLGLAFYRKDVAVSSLS